VKCCGKCIALLVSNPFLNNYKCFICVIGFVRLDSSKVLKLGWHLFVLYENFTGICRESLNLSAENLGLLELATMV
jgi:hypothetical protein